MFSTLRKERNKSVRTHEISILDKKGDKSLDLALLFVCRETGVSGAGLYSCKQDSFIGRIMLL